MAAFGTDTGGTAMAKRKPSKPRKVVKGAASGSRRRASAARGRPASRIRAASGAKAGGVVLLVATRKGLFLLRSNAARKDWRIDGPHFLGSIFHHAVLDPRDGRTILAAGSTGHLGPTVFRSEDGGRTWKEASRPPQFRKDDAHKRSVAHTFWLTPGHASEPGTWYAGASPPGLFRSRDGGVTWDPVSGWNDHPKQWEWTGSGQDGTPDGSKLHSVLVDPRDPRRLMLGVSSGGVFMSDDAGASWTPRNEGVAADFLPTKDPEFGHDPHCLVQHPLVPDRVYQQNHCGLYRLDLPATRWERIGRNMPKDVGDVGFPVVVHPRDAETLWVVPMDGTTVWPRTSVGGKPAVYRSSDGGATWRRLDGGMPRSQAWWTVKRQAFANDDLESVGLYFGTTSGEIWMGRDGGARWECLVRHLPHVYAVSVGRPR
jgi:photosystem II stability/assembly factor-like uncharacterized protein